jgi:hypothetical protein
MWAIGCIFYQLLHGKLLFTGDLKQVIKQHKEKVIDSEIDKSLSKQNVRLIKKCLKPISFQRFSFAKLIEDQNKK